MTGKRRWTWLLGVLAMAAGFSMMVAAYSAAGTKHKTAATKPIGTLRAVLDTIDYLDPQQAYTGQSWWAMWNVYETLLTYKHVDGPAGYKLVPGLAASLPTVSRNGKVYKFKLRKGLKYRAAVPSRRATRGHQARLPGNGPGVGFTPTSPGPRRIRRTRPPAGTS
jgi:peptide/nickel transport system substrate-binding protein